MRVVKTVLTQSRTWGDGAEVGGEGDCVAEEVLGGQVGGDVGAAEAVDGLFRVADDEQATVGDLDVAPVRRRRPRRRRRSGRRARSGSGRCPGTRRAAAAGTAPAAPNAPTGSRRSRSRASTSRSWNSSRPSARRSSADSSTRIGDPVGKVPQASIEQQLDQRAGDVDDLGAVARGAWRRPASSPCGRSVRPSARAGSAGRELGLLIGRGVEHQPELADLLDLRPASGRRRRGSPPPSSRSAPRRRSVRSGPASRPARADRRGPGRRSGPSRCRTAAPASAGASAPRRRPSRAAAARRSSRRPAAAAAAPTSVPRRRPMSRPRPARRSAAAGRPRSGARAGSAGRTSAACRSTPSRGRRAPRRPTARAASLPCLLELHAQPVAQFCAGLLGERDGRDRAQRYAVAQHQRDHPVDQRMRLARPGAGLDEERRAGVGADPLAGLGVQQSSVIGGHLLELQAQGAVGSIRRTRRSSAGSCRLRSQRARTSLCPMPSGLQ